MPPPNFHILQVAEITPPMWLHIWSERYGGEDDREHAELIARFQSLSAEDFVRIGKWKDGVLPNQDGKWKKDVASVAYLIWMQTASETPTCPPQAEVAAFLTEWSGRTYSDTFSSGRTVTKHFGLPRASTLLHFVSGGKYPILDSRVRAAIAYLYQCKVEDSVGWYVDTFISLFAELAETCETQSDLRKLDKALFAFGAYIASGAMKRLQSS
jgi:hypothetical protein